MSEEIEIAGIKVPKADWESTPYSIQSVVLLLSERVAQLEAKLAQLSEQVNQNSQNSSKPPSTDGFGQPKQGKGKHKQHQRRQRSSPSKAPRQARKLSAPESCMAIHEVLPKICHYCGTDLKGQDAHPHRHQVIELPKLEPSIIEYRLHQLNCHQCGRSSQAPLPVGVSSSGYGEHLSALVALLSGTYRQSYRQVCALMGEVFNVPLSRGCVGRLRQ